MARSTFRSPCQINDAHIDVADVSFNPVMHKGALLRVALEEVTGAIVFAIARDIENNEDISALSGLEALRVEHDRHVQAPPDINGQILVRFAGT